MDIFLPKKASNPLSFNYRPQIDITPTLSPQRAAYFQSLIGILRWIVELGQVDITCEVSMMTSTIGMPRDGHLKESFHIFSYLKHRHNSDMVFDLTVPEINGSDFRIKDKSHTTYAGSIEEFPNNSPETR